MEPAGGLELKSTSSLVRVNLVPPGLAKAANLALPLTSVPHSGYHVGVQLQKTRAFL